jgi:hypothetical protein
MVDLQRSNFSRQHYVSVPLWHVDMVLAPPKIRGTDLYVKLRVDVVLEKARGTKLAPALTREGELAQSRGR